MDVGSKYGSPPETTAKTSITCSNMPESLLETVAAKKHFGRFGRVKKILLRPKKQNCIVEYDTPVAAERALLNAGAYDGFMFDVTWTKKKKTAQRKEEAVVEKRKRPVKDDDPDWVPDSDVEDELTAMSAVPVYRQPRQQPMQQDQKPQQTIVRKVHSGRSTVTKVASKERPPPSSAWFQAGSTDSPAVVSVPTTMTTAEAASELQQLRTRVSRTPDEQKRTLDVRDRILRAWGGTGSRVRPGGATIGTCPDMCPEKERLQRQVEHQVNVLECESNTGDLTMCSWRAVKQYSRSSADQEIPMCYELRPPRVLALTMTYLLHEIASCTDYAQVSMADWFQFMWDRCRGIRKDITQQALCCAESVRLVEQCARFHAHCAARLADLEHTQFDQRLNTDNLTKCLQSLKHMYADLPAESKPCEAEFRSYVALLNLGDANFCWEIKQLPQAIQKSEAITFAVQIYMALDNNNYVRFFRLVREKATYLQACILLRYFNDVRARGLARIVKAFAPRGGSKYPVQELIDNLGFEDVKSLHSFITHYGLKFSRHDDIEPSVILDRNQFIEDSDPYPISRAINLIESKRNCSVGEIIAGGPLPDSAVYKNHIVHTSFNENGTLKQSALLAEDQEYGTINESNKDLRALKRELERMNTGVTSVTRNTELKSHPFNKTETKPLFGQKSNVFSGQKTDKETASAQQKLFSFKPAIPVVISGVVKSSPEKLFTQDTKAVFAFSKPDDNKTTNLWGANNPTIIFGSSNLKTDTSFAKPLIDVPKSVFVPNAQADKDKLLFKHPETTESNLFVKSSSGFETTNIKSSNPFLGLDTKHSETLKIEDPTNSGIGNVQDKTLFTRPATMMNIFGAANRNTEQEKGKVSLFTTAPNENLQVSGTSKSMFGQNASSVNVFSQKATDVLKSETPQNIFGQKSDSFKPTGNPFAQSDNSTKQDPKSLFGGSSNLFNKQNQQESTVLTYNTPPSPKTVFSSALAHKDTNKPPFGSILFGENKVLNAAFGPLSHPPNVQSNQVEDERQKEQRLQAELSRQQKELEERCQLEETKRLEEQRIQEQRRQEEIRRAELRRQEEDRKREEEKRRQEELQRQVEEARKQAELKRLAEEKLKAEEEQRKAEERQRLLAQIDKEAQELVEELANDIVLETVEDLTGKEIHEMNNLINFARDFADDILEDLINEVCEAETKAEKFLSEKLMLKYGKRWIAYTSRNIRRRMLLHDTPVWLAAQSPQEAANMLRRDVLPAALAKMTEFHRGRMFTGIPKPEPIITPYNIVDVVRTSLLKGLKRIKVNYHQCFFWKITVSSPGMGRWLNRKVNLHDWLLKKFSDGNGSSCDVENVIYLKQQSWNSLMNFAISVSMMEQKVEGMMEGSNGVIFYADENDKKLLSRIKEQLKMKSAKQLIPVAVLVPCSDTFCLEELLSSLTHEKSISVYKILQVDPHDTQNSLDKCTKSALKWLAKNIPDTPPLEMNSLMSVLHHCVGMEFWYRLKLERHTGMDHICKDLNKLTTIYNAALEKLANILTDDSIQAYPSFPIELKQFLEFDSTLPKPYEFFPEEWASVDNFKVIKNTVCSLKLQQPNFWQRATGADDLQKQVQNFVDEIEWFPDSSLVSSKIISHLPRELANRSMDTGDFWQYYVQYDFLDMISVAVVEKINSMSELKDKYVIYDRTAMANFRSTPWWYETELVSLIKQKPLDFIQDEIDEALNESFARNAKRMRYDKSDEVALEEKDESRVEESICMLNSEIEKLNSCNTSLKELEQCLEEEAVKASKLEELLRAALYDDQ